MAADRRPTLIIDNYDSYTHNLYQLCWSVSGVEPLVIRNDEEKLFRSLLSQLAFDNIIISPGPGSPDRPEDFGICAQILKAPPAPVLGVCLGCQGIGWMYGLDVRKAPGGAMHGRTSVVFHNEGERGGGGLFAGIPNGFTVVRYHSLAICPNSPGDAFPAELERTAWTADGVIMGLQHRKLPLWGVQFHPESICSEFGAELIANFLALADAHKSSEEAGYSNASTPPCATAHSWPLDLDDPPPPPINLSDLRHSVDSLARLASSEATCHMTHASKFVSKGDVWACGRSSASSCCSSSCSCGAHSKGLKLKVLHRLMHSRLETETLYMTRLSRDKQSFWLDSSRREQGAARFSYMGGSTGPLSFQLRYNLEQRSLDASYSCGCEERLEECDVLKFLEHHLVDKKIDAHPQLPFDFVGGFVGYLGYELKELCEDGIGHRNGHVSEEPDAVMLFADRFLVWDHEKGDVHAVALVAEGDEELERAGAAWLDVELGEVQRLSSLSLRDTLAERHEAMREAMDETSPALRVQQSCDSAATEMQQSSPALRVNESSPAFPHLHARESLGMQQPLVPPLAPLHSHTESNATSNIHDTRDAAPAGEAASGGEDEERAATAARQARAQRGLNMPDLGEHLPGIAGEEVEEGGGEEWEEAERAQGDEPPTITTDDYEQEPSHTPAGPGALSFPPVQPEHRREPGPGSAPRGAMPQADEGQDAWAAHCNASSRQQQPAQAAAASGSSRQCWQQQAAHSRHPVHPQDKKDAADSGASSCFASTDSEAEYQHKIRQCLEHILEGEAYELCLTTRHRSRRGLRVHALRFYQRLRAVNPAPYSALLQCGPGLAVCSSSPERFLSVSAEGLCDSKPIKGTRRRGASAEEDADICQELRSSEKDLAENLMIVDLVRNDFGRVCTEGSVCCPKIMDVETYATVHQLVSTIQGHKKPHLHTIDVVRATFPMGSMTGAPKRRSLALLDALESDARGIYSGAIGFLSLNGAAHFAVAIRTAVVTDTGVKVGAGGAITVLSDARDEWDEMQLKASVLLSCAHAVASSTSASSFALPLTSATAGAAASKVASSGMA